MTGPTYKRMLMQVSTNITIPPILITITIIATFLSYFYDMTLFYVLGGVFITLSVTNLFLVLRRSPRSVVERDSTDAN